MTLYSHKILGRIEREIPKKLENIVVQVLYLRALKDATHVSIFIGLCVDYVNFPAEGIKIPWRRVFFPPLIHTKVAFGRTVTVVMSQRASLN